MQIKINQTLLINKANISNIKAISKNKFFWLISSLSLKLEVFFLNFSKFCKILQWFQLFNPNFNQFFLHKTVTLIMYDKNSRIWIVERWTAQLMTNGNWLFCSINNCIRSNIFFIFLISSLTPKYGKSRTAE